MLSKFSVKKPYTVVVAVALVLVLGVISFTRMTTDLLPSMNFPYLVVVTTYPGASPEEVEQTVTVPVEQVAATTSNLKSLNSTSSENMSMVICEFEDGANMDTVLIEMRENLDQVTGYWPDEVGSPLMMKINPDMLPVMTAAVEIAGLDSAALGIKVENDILPAVESVEGVGSASSSGGVEQSVQVVLRQEKIDEMNQQIVAKLDEKFGEARQKLEEAKGQIEEGQQQVEAGQQALTQQIPDAENQLNSANTQTLEGEIALNEALSELLAKEVQLAYQEAQLQSTETQLQGIQLILNGASGSMKDLMDKLEKAREELEAIKNNNTLPEEEKTELIRQLEEQIAKLEAQLKGISDTLEAMGMTAAGTLEDMSAYVQQKQEQLAEGKAALAQAKQAIETGKQKIEESRAQLKEGRGTISEQLAVLNQKKAEAEQQLEQGKEALAEGQKVLEEQTANFDAQQQAAYDAADLNQIITIDMIGKMLTAQNFSMPAGYISAEGVDYLVRVGDKLGSTEEMEQMVLFDLGVEGMEPICLGDVADVSVVDNSDQVYAKLNGNDGLILTMQKQTGYSTAEVSDAIQERFEQLEKTEEGLHFTILMDQGIYIDMVVDSVLQNMLIGGLLAIFVLLFFLKDLKPTVIIACSIPISILFAVVMMYFSGVTLNIISLSGLALGVGMLVDNSIVVIENIYRLRSLGVPAKEAAVRGAKGVASAIMASTLTTVAVFLPIVFVEGITRQLFVDMALTIGYSLLASLIVALTLVPMMSAGMLVRDKKVSHPLLETIQNAYGKSVGWALKHRAAVLLATLALLIASVFGALSNGTAFIPAMESNQMSVKIQMPEGSEFADTAEMADAVSDAALAVEGVDSVGAMIGGGGMMAMMGGSSSGGSSAADSATLYVIMKEDYKDGLDKIKKEIEERTRDLDCEVKISSESMDMSALGGSGLSVVVRGRDLDKLQELAKQAAAVVTEVEGTVEVSDGIEETTPEYRFVVDREKAAAKGLTTAQVYAALAAELADAQSVTTLQTEARDYSVYVSSDSDTEKSLDTLKELKLSGTVQGQKEEVPLMDVVKLEKAEGLSSIHRESQQRTLTVSAEIDDDHNIGLVSAEVERRLKEMEVPEGFSVQIEGESETINSALNDLILMLVLAVVLMYMIMVAQFQSLLSPFIIMFTIPLAFTGGLLALFFTGSEVSVIAMIGFVMLAGIIVNNGIVLVDYINQLRDSGMDRREAIMEAGRTRLRPIVMTALTTIMGLSIMVFSQGMGADMTRPLALVTIGGLIYGTFLTLYVVPCIYDLFARRRKAPVEINETDGGEESE